MVNQVSFKSKDPQKYDWNQIEDNPVTLNLNRLHKVNTCGVCGEFVEHISRCLRRNMIVNSESQQCEPGIDFLVRI